MQQAQVVAAVIMVVRAVHRLDNLMLHATVACISGYENNNTTGQTKQGTNKAELYFSCHPSKHGHWVVEYEAP